MLTNPTSWTQRKTTFPNLPWSYLGPRDLVLANRVWVGLMVPNFSFGSEISCNFFLSLPFLGDNRGLMWKMGALLGGNSWVITGGTVTKRATQSVQAEEGTDICSVEALRYQGLSLTPAWSRLFLLIQTAWHWFSFSLMYLRIAYWEEVFTPWIISIFIAPHKKSLLSLLSLEPPSTLWGKFGRCSSCFIYRCSRHGLKNTVHNNSGGSVSHLNFKLRLPVSNFSAHSPYSFCKTGMELAGWQSQSGASKMAHFKLPVSWS